LVIANHASTASAETAALKTPWGDPDLQGIWTDETDTPLQRSPRYASQESFAEVQRAELDSERAALLGRDKRAERGTEFGAAGTCNAVFLSIKRMRTSMTYGLPGQMRGARMEEAAFAEGRGPNPATRDGATDFVGVEGDPLQ
jgi:hypothetical protein